jgi:hypothetical protein
VRGSNGRVGQSPVEVAYVLRIQTPLGLGLARPSLFDGNVLRANLVEVVVVGEVRVRVDVTLIP